MLILSKFGKWSVTAGIGISGGLLAAFADGIPTSVLVLSAGVMSLVVATLFILVKLNELLRAKK